ncbi:poly(R)-hydroxyalkanoic acid synthase [Hylemonella gracilis str. Niagara R]|uniref:Poly(R)-hydroxyalkanoic acid synthase n=2 Tax=Hylemonella gracilis TaxID=80880 RepID=A0A016XID4_9BURK|nr:alpha/beta fold hydrolase [Hylemonella gracilis]EYC51571.1 poly(R)-hydroxyalkanoic acid synthase [Hylemonella gracilis str. Niagara R]
MNGAEGENARGQEHTADAMAAWTAWMQAAAQAAQQAQAQAAALTTALTQGVPAGLQGLFPWSPGWPPASTPMPAVAAAPGMGTWAPGLPASAFPLHELPRIPSDTLQSLQQQYLNDCFQLAREGWQEDSAQALHALNARLLTQMAEAVQADAKTRARIRFGVDQWVAASAPGNFMAFNRDAQRKAIETQGRSVAQGLQNLLHDLGRGQVSMTDESQFEVGRNVATTAGAVVYENELFQLLEYQPVTEQVHARPLLLVPPCINKFYILDLQPSNSLIRYALTQGHRVYVISWRNPPVDPADPDHVSLATKTWDDYVEQAVIRAITVTREIAAPKLKGGGGSAQADGDGLGQINALGFCVGGTLLGTALAVLAARGQKPVASLTLLTTFLDFSDTGVLDVFIDEAAVRLREQQFAQGGVMPGRDLAATFSFLRPTELVWNYVARNYLQGETPPPFDLLYWNGDSTNLPGPWYAWYLRNTYLENNLVQPGRLTVCGEKIDLRRLDLPAYIYGSREDHIVPVSSAYASTQVLGGPLRFVMGASGHIAGVINPPEKKKRSHWTRADGQLPPRLDDWLAGAQEQAGSWWPDWAAWLRQHAGPQVPAPKKYGKGRYKAIEPAPGRYVRQRA